MLDGGELTAEKCHTMDKGYPIDKQPPFNAGTEYNR